MFAVGEHPARRPMRAYELFRVEQIVCNSGIIVLIARISIK